MTKKTRRELNILEGKAKSAKYLAQFALEVANTVKARYLGMDVQMKKGFTAQNERIERLEKLFQLKEPTQ